MDVFTYGTLMFSEVWKIVVGREFHTVPALLEGFAAYRVSHAPYPGILAESGATVRGLVYLDVDAESLSRLDTFEGEFYERLTLPVASHDGVQRQAAAYTVRARHRHILTAEPWTSESFVARGGLDDFIRRYQGFSWLRDEPARVE